MNAHKGLSKRPTINILSAHAIQGYAGNEPKRQAGKPDLKIGDYYNGLAIIGITEDLYVCKHKSGYIECFQKENYRYGLGESEIYITDLDLMTN